MSDRLALCHHAQKGNYHINSAKALSQRNAKDFQILTGVVCLLEHVDQHYVFPS